MTPTSRHRRAARPPLTGRRARIVLAVAGRGSAAFVVTSAALLLTASLAAPGWERAPQLPAPATRPLAALDLAPPPPGGRSERAVTVTATGAAGWLFLPDGDVAVAVVVQPGAGRADRDAARAEAEHLAALGIAALTYDKRPTGPSPVTRDYPTATADLAAAVEQLRRETGAERIGIVSVSEGGWLAPGAARMSGADFLVLTIAPTVTPLEQAAWVVDARLAGAPDWVRRVPATALASGRNRFDYLDADPVPDLSAADLPVLGLWGAEDPVVPVTAAIERTHRAAGDRLVAVVLPGVGHEVPPEALDLAAAWILSGSPAGADPAAGAGGPIVHGVAPSRHTGIGELPSPAWYTSPALHLVLSAGAAVIAVLGTLRRRKV